MDPVLLWIYAITRTNKSMTNSLLPVEVKTYPCPESGPEFTEVLNDHGLNLFHNSPSELQLNLGKMCNLACHHCHVDAGPKRTEIMQWMLCNVS